MKSPKEGLERGSKRKTPERKIELRVWTVLHRSKKGIILDRYL
jgi:hypothetical protein